MAADLVPAPPHTHTLEFIPTRPILVSEACQDHSAAFGWRLGVGVGRGGQKSGGNEKTAEKVMAGGFASGMSESLGPCQPCRSLHPPCVLRNQGDNMVSRLHPLIRQTSVHTPSILLNAMLPTKCCVGCCEDIEGP